MYMSDFIFMIEKTQSSGKQSENNNKFGKGTTHDKGAKKLAGKHACAQYGAKIERKALLDN